MKDLFEKIKNIFKIPELKDRILYTVGLLAVFRLGSYVVLPGIDSSMLQTMFDSGQGGGILGIVDLFAGGAFSRGAVFALGIMPYISASIILQLLGTAIPVFQKWRREGESGTKKINQWTRYLTVIITFFQGAAYVANLQYSFNEAIIFDSSFFYIISIFLLSAGTMFLVWLGEKITDKGIGNGISLLIMIGIIAELPTALLNEFQSNALMVFFAEIIALGVVTMAVIALTQATRKIPINYARRMMGNKMSSSARQYIPLKVNSAGVMPIIFAQSIMFVPAMVMQAFPGSDFWSKVAIFTNPGSVGYNVLFGVMIVVFTYFYTAIIINPNEIADQLKRQGGFIPGVKPGKKTAEFIDRILSRITLPGSIFLAIVAIFPAIAASMGVSQGFSQFFGGTSLLIMIGVVLDTLQQINSYLLMRHYDGLMKSGKVKRNQGIGATV